MKDAIKRFLRFVKWSAIASFLIFSVVAITRDAEAEKWSNLLDETRSRIPEIKVESTQDTVVRIAKDEGIDWLMAVRIIDCESRWDKFYKEKMKGGSYDRGLWAINSYHYKQVSDDCAFDPECATRVFAEAYRNGKASDWLCYRVLGFK